MFCSTWLSTPRRRLYFEKRQLLFVLAIGELVEGIIRKAPCTFGAGDNMTSLQVGKDIPWRSRQTRNPRRRRSEAENEISITTWNWISFCELILMLAVLGGRSCHGGAAYHRVPRGPGGRPNIQAPRQVREHRQVRG